MFGDIYGVTKEELNDAFNELPGEAEVNILNEELWQIELAAFIKGIQKRSLVWENEDIAEKDKNTEILLRMMGYE